MGNARFLDHQIEHRGAAYANDVDRRGEIHRLAPILYQHIALPIAIRNSSDGNSWPIRLIDIYTNEIAHIRCDCRRKITI